MAIELPADYYLDNFRDLLQFVRSTYADLLIESEKQFADQLMDLSEPAVRLYIRLLCRSKSIFRLDKLHYSEIPDLISAAAELEESGYLQINPEYDVQSLLPLLTKQDIANLLSAAAACEADQKGKSLSVLKRAELENLALDNLPDSAVIFQQMTVLEVLNQDHFEVYKLCFFGNLYQDMTDYVLRDLGLTQFETYELDKQYRAFDSREKICSHLAYYQCSYRFDQLAPDDIDAQIQLASELPEPIDNALQRRVDRLRNKIARNLERQKSYEQALDLFEKSARPPARERRARILATLQRDHEALELCAQIASSPFNEEERHSVTAFAARLAKRCESPWPKPSLYKPPQHHLTLKNREGSVEYIVRDYFNEQSTNCFYTENVLCNSVFGLFFWDIVFAPVAGVFYNPFQQAPADFYEPEFVRTREPLLKARLDMVRNPGQLRRLVLQHYERKHGLQNPMVNWRYLELDLLEQALERIPLVDWETLFQRLLLDLRAHRTGFPDLVVFPDVGGYEFVEVKGPGDTLQKNQLRWMEYFAKVGIKHSVCHVEWAGEIDGSPVVEESVIETD